MSDMGEMFNDWRKAKQEKRASNRDASAQLLLAAGIGFESRNDGAHLIVAGRYDFWPGTGLWMARGEKTKRRGVHALIKRIKGLPSDRPTGTPVRLPAASALAVRAAVWPRRPGIADGAEAHADV